MAFALVITLLMPFLGVIHLTPLSLMHLSGTVRPNVIENGTDVAYLPFPTDLPYGALGDVAFGPDGSAYFVDAPGEIARVTPTGVYTKIPAPHAAYGRSILYAHGSLWVAADQGIERVAVSGLNSRWYQLNRGQEQFKALGGYRSSIINGPNGSVVAAGYFNLNDNFFIAGELVSIDVHGNVTITSTPGIPAGPLIFDSAGRLYFYYTASAQDPNIINLARLETNGSVTIVPLPLPANYQLEAIYSIVRVRGTLYFTGQVSNADDTASSGFFGEIPRNGVVNQIPLPGGTNTHVSDLTADFGGNLWLHMAVAGSSTLSLYGYDTYNGAYSAAIEPSLLSGDIGDLYIGPDDNIWMPRYDQTAAHYDQIMGFDVYVRHVQTLEPASLMLARNQTSSFSILEPQVSGPWSAQALNPRIATVTPASSATGVFSVQAVGHGTSLIQVKDHLGNISYETITAS